MKANSPPCPTGSPAPAFHDGPPEAATRNELAEAGATGYITKNKGTSASLFTDWEIHGKKSGTDITPGQAVTIEWGLGQVLPLDKEFHKLLQFGVIGYDQWQVSSNSGTLTLPAGIMVPASSVPYYSAHAVGMQANFIAPKAGLNFFFKYLPEYMASSRPKAERSCSVGPGR